MTGPGWAARLDRVSAGLVLLLPLPLLHGRALADGVLTAVAVLFLIRSALLRDGSWLRRGWVRIGLAWWGWLVLCSLRGGTAAEAAVTLRFLLFAAALEHCVLDDERVQRWLSRLLRWAAFYLAAQCALQFAWGRNLFGWPRGADGELTGPYKNPRVGPPLSRLFFPALLPLASTPWRAGLWLSAGLAVMIVIGQRMPLLLVFGGLGASALFLRRLRAPVGAAAAAAVLLLLALPTLSPEAAHRIEGKFARQMADLPDSHYGQIAARAVAIVRDRPLLGAGFDGFRRLCDEPRYFAGWHGGDGGGAAICVQHPHSYYLQAAVEGGLPGLLLFGALAAAWLLAAGRGLRQAPDRLRTGLFVAALIQLWPLASSTDWVSMPLAGWFFLQLGLALALSRPYMPAHPIEAEDAPCPTRPPLPRPSRSPS